MISFSVQPASRSERYALLDPLAQLHGLSARGLPKELQLLLLEEAAHQARARGLREALDSLSCPEKREGLHGEALTRHEKDAARWREDHKLFSWLLIEEDLCHHQAPDTPYGEQTPPAEPTHWLGAPGVEAGDFLRAGGKISVHRRPARG